MNSPCKPQTSQHGNQAEADALELLRIALEKDLEANDAMEAAVAAFKKLNLPLPLFEQLDSEGR